MPRIARRTLIRDGGIAASVAALTQAGQSNAAAQEDTSGNVFHVFAFRWKPDTSQAQKDRAAKDIAAFPGQIAGLLQTHVGPNIFGHEESSASCNSRIKPRLTPTCNIPRIKPCSCGSFH